MQSPITTPAPVLLLKLDSIAADPPAQPQLPQLPAGTQLTFVKRSERAYTAVFKCACGARFIDSFNNTPKVRLTQHRSMLKNPAKNNKFYSHLRSGQGHSLSTEFDILNEYPTHQTPNFLHAKTKEYFALMKTELN